MLTPNPTHPEDSGSSWLAILANRMLYWYYIGIILVKSVPI